MTPVYYYQKLRLYTFVYFLPCITIATNNKTFNALKTQRCTFRYKKRLIVHTNMERKDSSTSSTQKGGKNGTEVERNWNDAEKNVIEGMIAFTG